MMLPGGERTSGIMGVVDPAHMPPGVVPHGFLFNVSDYPPGRLSLTNHIRVGCSGEISSLVGVRPIEFLPSPPPALLLSLKARSI